jgi:hypothetical protein
MKAKSPVTELLLLTNSKSCNSFCELKGKETYSHDSKLKGLENACWNGILNDLISDVTGHPSGMPVAFIWSILPGDNFLHICLSAYPQRIENEMSIDPYFFLTAFNKN